MSESNLEDTETLITNLNKNVDWIIRDRAKQISNRVNKRTFVALEKRNTNLKLKLKENLRKLQELQELNKIENQKQISKLLAENKELKEEIDIYTTPVQNILAASPPIFLYNDNVDDDDNDDNDQIRNNLIISQCDKITTLNSELLKLKKDFEKNQSIIDDLEKNQLIIVDLETLKSEIENLKNINDNLQNDNLQNKNLNLAEINYLKQELKKFKEIEYEKQKLQNKLEKNNTKSLILENEINQLQHLLQELTSTNAELINNVKELKINLESNIQKEKKTSRILLKQKKLNLSLNFDLTEKDKEILKKQEKISQLEKNNKSLRDTLETKNSEIKLLNEDNTNLNKDLESIKSNKEKITKDNLNLNSINNKMLSELENLKKQIRTYIALENSFKVFVENYKALETKNEELKNEIKQLETWNDEQNKERSQIMENATILFNENKRLSSNRHDLIIELSRQNEMLETFEKKITHYSNFIESKIKRDPAKKAILLRICENYSSLYKKGIACNSRSTKVSNILEQLLRIDFDNKENTIEEEITKGFEIPMYGSAN